MTMQFQKWPTKFGFDWPFCPSNNFSLYCTLVSYLEHVIVAGGSRGNESQDDIEVLDWMENSCWRKVSISLPVPMEGFKPIIAEGHLCIVGYSKDNEVYDDAYKIPVVDITRSGDQQITSDTPTKWITMTPADDYFTVLVPSSSPLVLVGGANASQTISDIKMYDDSSKSWRKVASLSSARSNMAIAAVNDNAIIVIGGCTKLGGDALSSSLTTVELGQSHLNRV